MTHPTSSPLPATLRALSQLAPNPRASLAALLAQHAGRVSPTARALGVHRDVVTALAAALGVPLPAVPPGARRPHPKKSTPGET